MPLSTPQSYMVPTPKPLANAMVRAIGDTGRELWLDPCLGTGVFPEALAKMGVPSRRIIAIDLERTRSCFDTRATTTRGVDFVSWASSTGKRFDRIVANPPYVSLDKLDVSLQHPALRVKAPDGTATTLGSNYWCVFLCASLNLLRPGGSVCFVLPAAWEYANYAEHLRIVLPALFASFEVHRSLEPMFHEVQEGCVVIKGVGFRSGERHDCLRREHKSAVELIRALLGGDHHDDARGSHGIRVPKSPSNRLGRRLGDVLEVGLGGVTGDARYFLMNEQDRCQRGLPFDSCRPVLTRARHLVAGEIAEEHWAMLRDRGERVWLFCPPDHLLEEQAVRAYLELPTGQGGCRRDGFKVRTRFPWYRTPLPERVDGFMSGMSNLGPWICLNAMQRLNATNTLYVVRFREAFSPDEKAAWALSLLTSEARRHLKTVGRLYAEGLLKHEPGDLMNVALCVPHRTGGAKEYYLRAVQCLLSRDVEQSSHLADSWFES